MSMPQGKSREQRKAEFDEMLIRLAARYGGRPNFDPNAESDPDDSDFVPDEEGEDDASFTDSEEEESESEIEEAEEAEEEESTEPPAKKSRE